MMLQVIYWTAKNATPIVALFADCLCGGNYPQELGCNDYPFARCDGLFMTIGNENIVARWLK